MTEEETPYEIREGNDRVLVTWRGRWDEATGNRFASAMHEFLDARAGAPGHLVVDATELAHCSILARGRLADLQEEIRQKIARCVYIASSARMRGLCLWIVKVADDERAKVLANDRDVDSWLNSSLTRIEAHKQGVMGGLNKIGSKAG